MENILVPSGLPTLSPYVGLYHTMHALNLSLEVGSFHVRFILHFAGVFFFFSFSFDAHAQMLMSLHRSICRACMHFYVHSTNLWIIQNTMYPLSVKMAIQSPLLPAHTMCQCGSHTTQHTYRQRIYVQNIFHFYVFHDELNRMKMK